MQRRWAAIMGVMLLGLGALGQEKPSGSKPGGDKPDKPAIAPTVETLRLKLPELRRTDAGEIARLRSGDLEFNPPEPQRKELLQRVAQYYIFRLTHEVPLYTTATGSDSLREHVTLFAKSVLPLQGALEGNPDTSAAQTLRIRQYAAELATVSVPLFMKVLQDPRPIVRINAMRMAYLFAERGIGEIHPVLMYAFEQYPIDAAAVFQVERYWAIRGLGELFHATVTNRDPKRVVLPPEVTVKAASSIYQWLRWAYHIDPAQVKRWNLEETDGLRYLRRQAVRSLGLLRRPVVNPADAQDRQRIAELWWQIMKDEGSAKLSPAPSWSERVEAAVALLGIPPEPKGPYQADFAYHEVGRFVIDLVTAANADPEGREAWQHHAAYLRARLVEVQQHPAYAKADYAKKIIPLMMKPLDELSRMRTGEAPRRIEPKDLEKFLDTTPPKATELFKPPPPQS